MLELIYSISIREKYNEMPLEESVKEFEKFTNQKIPLEAISEFYYIGLSNIDFYTSDWLHRYGLKNLFGYDKKSVFDKRFLENNIAFILTHNGKLGEHPESKLVIETKNEIVNWLTENFEIIKKSSGGVTNTI